MLAACGAVLILSACDPRAIGDRPFGTAAPPAAGTVRLPEPAVPSPQAQALSQYYARVEEGLLARGLLRTDGGGVDTPFTDEMLARNFERIALAEEYTRGAGLRPSAGALGEIKKWDMPVRVGVVFGDSHPAEAQMTDRREIARFVRRLARVTGHPIATVSARPNFHVLVMGADDADQLRATLANIAPDMDAASRAIFLDPPRAIHCLVVAFAENATSSTYRQAIALIRTEHPDLTRQACIHEELAQGLGLPNDDQNARPSIFNDDEEFALLTTHDEVLLSMLYDPRLQPGMRADSARPLIRRLAQERVTGGES